MMAHVAWRTPDGDPLTSPRRMRSAMPQSCPASRTRSMKQAISISNCMTRPPAPLESRQPLTAEAEIDGSNNKVCHAMIFHPDYPNLNHPGGTSFLTPPTGTDQHPTKDDTGEPSFLLLGSHGGGSGGNTTPIPCIVVACDPSIPHWVSEASVSLPPHSFAGLPYHHCCTACQANGDGVMTSVEMIRSLLG